MARDRDFGISDFSVFGCLAVRWKILPKQNKLVRDRRKDTERIRVSWGKLKRNGAFWGSCPVPRIFNFRGAWRFTIQTEVWIANPGPNPCIMCFPLFLPHQKQPQVTHRAKHFLLVETPVFQFHGSGSPSRSLFGPVKDTFSKTFKSREMHGEENCQRGRHLRCCD